MKENYFSKEYMQSLDAYWRACNYLSVAQLYLLDNPLMRDHELCKDDIKKKLVGHWGTVPGQNFVYAHCNRVINKYDLNMILLSGPGHGGNFLTANCFMEGTYTEFFPNINFSHDGMKRFCKQFSFPGGIGSHAVPETPGSMHEGGELGYSLAHAFGAVMDNPNLIATVVVGDGEAETGPLATAWHGNKFLNPKMDGVDQEGSVDKKIADKISEVNTAAGNLEKRVKANEDAITVINGDGEGSIKDAVAKLVNGAPEAMNTLNELANAITEHESTYQAYVAQVAKDIAAAKQEAITTAGTNADTKDQALHTNITTEIATAKSEAIADAAAKDSALETKLQANIDKKVDKTVYDAKVAELAQADTDNLTAAKKYADDEDAKIEAMIGTKEDLATADTVYGKIKALQEKDASQDGVIATKAAAADLDTLEALVGTVDDTKTEATVFGKIAAEADRAKVAEEALAGRVTTAEGKITALEGKVGDAQSGLVKDVADLKGTVGSAASGLVKDVAELKAKDTALDSEISALKAKDESLQGSITTNAGSIATLQGDMTDAKATIEGHGTAITALQQWQNNHGEILESELDAMLDAAYGVTQA